MTSWRQVQLAGMQLPVAYDWEKISSEPTRYGSSDGWVDVRSVDDGDFVDLARANATRLALRAQGNDADVGIVLVRDMPAVRAIYRLGRRTVLTYVIARLPSGHAGTVTLPEVRVVYVLEGDGRAESELARQLETTTTAFLEALELHTKTQEGHLSFGPFSVPAEWAVVQDDGTRLAMPNCDGPLRSVDVGGGAVSLTGEPSAQLVEGVVFRPTTFEGRLDDATSWSNYGVARKREFEHAGIELASRSCSLARLRFGAEIAGRFESDLGDRASSVRLGFEVGFVFRDLLKYWWEMTFTFRSGREVVARDVLATVERE